MSIFKFIKNWFSFLSRNEKYIPMKYLNVFGEKLRFEEDTISSHKVDIDDLFSGEFKTAIVVDTDAQSTFWFEWHDITAQYVRNLKQNYGLETYGFSGSYSIFRTTKSKEEIETIRILLNENFVFLEEKDLT